MADSGGLQHGDVEVGALAGALLGRTSADDTARAAARPPTVSQTGKPTRSGAVSGGAGDAHHPGEALDDLVVGRAVAASGRSAPNPEMAQ